MTSASALPSPVSKLRTYGSFVRFEHTLFSLPLVLAGVFSWPGAAMDVARWSWIALAAVGARTSAMALNRLIDRRLDALNPRTRARELPSGAIKTAEALALLIGSAGLYLGACAALGPWYVRLAAVPLAVFAIYPYLKRWTPFCHFGVGLALALAPLAGYAAAHPDLAHPEVALWISLFALLWVSGFDIIYATLDEAFDHEQGVHSMVAWLGRVRALQVSAFLHRAAALSLVPAVVAILHLVPEGPFSRPVPAVMSLALLTTVAVLLALEQRWAENVNLAFFKVNVWVGFAVLAMVLVARTAAGFR
jgi:4-hydroxybenzoate polyprenyltransferase